MREIKFRAWCKLDKILYDWEQVKKEFTLEYFDDRGLVFQQYACFEDVNGIEFCDGDIVIYTQKSINYANTYSHSYAEVFINKQGAYRVRGNHIYEFEAYGNRKQLEIVGNVYENSELLDKNYWIDEQKNLASATNTN